MTVFWLLLFALVAFLIVIFVRALRFTPGKEQATAPEPVETDGERAVRNLQAMLRCRTVSYTDESLIDQAEFDKFRALLPELYPNVFARCAFERIGPAGVVLKLPGQSAEKPSVLMGHYDVVPVDEDGWERPPFDALIEDGVLWGRGTLDTKTTVCATLEAAETLLSSGFTPKNDLYFAFGGDEETTGKSQEAIVAAFAARGIRPALVLDEGGAVVENVFPGVKAPCALIGVAEKGLIDARFSIDGAGGHASAPPVRTPIGRLARAVVRVEKHPFPFRVTKAAADMFNVLGRHSTFGYRLIFANLWCFRPLLNLICRLSGGELNALMRTTCAFTTMQGSNATNVLPPHAYVGANLRIISGETPAQVRQRLERLAGDPGIQVVDTHSMAPSPVSETEGEAWELIKRATQQTWPEAIVSPYLMVACSDARHYAPISNHVYRFCAMSLSNEERACIHGNNERIRVENVKKSVQFYARLMKNL